MQASNASWRASIVWCTSPLLSVPVRPPTLMPPPVSGAAAPAALIAAVDVAFAGFVITATDTRPSCRNAAPGSRVDNTAGAAAGSADGFDCADVCAATAHDTSESAHPLQYTISHELRRRA